MSHALLHRVLLILLLALTLPLSALAADDDKKETGDPNAVGHSADGNYYDLTPFGIIELPRIMLVRNASGSLKLHAFGSTHSALDSGLYTLANQDGTLMDDAAAQALVEDHHRHLYYDLQPKEGSMVLDLSITRQLMFVFICLGILTFVMLRLAGRYKRGVGRDEAPKGRWQNMLEVVIVFIRDEVAKAAIGEKHYKKHLPYLLTVFFFILIGNLVGLVPFGVTATSHIMVTGALAFITFIIIQFSGSKDYWRHIFWPPDAPFIIKFILIPIEVIGIFTKPLALAFRLFGNMISGHVAIVSIIGLIFMFAAQLGQLWGWVAIGISIPLTVFIYMLKILVSFIQAYIFTMLSAVFIGMAAEEHHHDEHHGAHGEQLAAETASH